MSIRKKKQLNNCKEVRYHKKCLSIMSYDIYKQPSQRKQQDKSKCINKILITISETVFLKHFSVSKSKYIIFKSKNMKKTLLICLSSFDNHYEKIIFLVTQLVTCYLNRYHRHFSVDVPIKPYPVQQIYIYVQ